MFNKVRNVLFDLDGTLLDTAPDMVYAINQVRQEYGMPSIELSKIRLQVSLGAVAIIKEAFNLSNNDPDIESIRQKFLTNYSENIYRETRFFEGMENVLDTLDRHGIAWGIVTNKAEWLTTLLVEEMQLNLRTNCIVNGNTLPVAKPNPEPLLYACNMMNCAPENAVYIGDAIWDIEAGTRAGMPTILARYGYINLETDLDEWGATAIIDTPNDILGHLRLD
jgi:N-acetyl-D-muramate 6-phosphate phosphatase